MSQIASHGRGRVDWRDSQTHADAAPPYVTYRWHQSRWIFPRWALGWMVLTLTWPLLEMALDQHLVDEWTAIVILLTCSLLAIVLLLVDPVRRLAGVLWAFLFAYTSGAFVARYGFDLSYFPFVSDEVFDQTMLGAVRAFVLSIVVLFPLLREKWCLICLATVTSALNQVATTPRHRIFGICAVMVMLGGLEWAFVAKTGIGIITESGRRSFADDLLLASDHNVQVIAIPITILALISAWQTRDQLLRTVVTICVGFAWLPSLLAGARKEIFIICIAASIPKMLKLRPLGLTTPLLVACAAIVFISIPVLFDGDFARGFQEFILPFYNVISIHEYGDYLRPTTSFLSGTQLLLPSFLRPMDARVFGTDITDLMLALGQNVSYGGQPYAESLAFAEQAPCIMFLVSNIILLGACFVLARMNPIYALIAFPYLALWGRSILWLTLFFILYGGLVMILVTGRRSRNRASLPQGHTPTERMRALEDLAFCKRRTR
jgi:hypothetical protein